MVEAGKSIVNKQVQVGTTPLISGFLRRIAMSSTSAKISPGKQDFRTVIVIGRLGAMEATE